MAIDYVEFRVFAMNTVKSIMRL